MRCCDHGCALKKELDGIRESGLSGFFWGCSHVVVCGLGMGRLVPVSASTPIFMLGVTGDSLKTGHNPWSPGFTVHWEKDGFDKLMWTKKHLGFFFFCYRHKEGYAFICSLVRRITQKVIGRFGFSGEVGLDPNQHRDPGIFWRIVLLSLHFLNWWPYCA